MYNSLITEEHHVENVDTENFLAPGYYSLLDSIPFLDQFSDNRQSQMDVGDETWSGTYIMGNNHYLVFFKPCGFRGVKFGDLGIGFMTNIP